jgi:TolA-binding protein
MVMRALLWCAVGAVSLLVLAGCVSSNDFKTYQFEVDTRFKGAESRANELDTQIKKGLDEVDRKLGRTAEGLASRMDSMEKDSIPKLNQQAKKAQDDITALQATDVSTRKDVTEIQTTLRDLGIKLAQIRDDADRLQKRMAEADKKVDDGFREVNKSLETTRGFADMTFKSVEEGLRLQLQMAEQHAQLLNVTLRKMQEAKPPTQLDAPAPVRPTVRPTVPAVPAPAPAPAPAPVAPGATPAPAPAPAPAAPATTTPGAAAPAPAPAEPKP